MTPQEQQLLKGLADRINQTVLADKDPEAEQFLTQSLSRNSDALYIMAQTILVQQFAVDNAKKQLDDLKQQLDQARQQAQQQAAQPVKHTSFLGGLLGGDEPQRSAPPPPPPQQYSQPQYQPVQNYGPPQPQYGQPQYVQPAYAQPSFLPGGGGGGGFLGSALKTAGIVGAGALAFEGVESLMHGFGEHAGYGGGYGEMGGGGGPREEVINNYYDGGRPEHRGLSSDIEDRRDDGDNQRGFADTSSDDVNSSDDTNFDDSSDDASNFDDSGSDDNS